MYIALDFMSYIFHHQSTVSINLFNGAVILIIPQLHYYVAISVKNPYKKRFALFGKHKLD